MAMMEEDSLEVLLNKATGPLSSEADFDCVTLFCQKVDEEFEGALTSTKLLAHKIQSPQEHEALQALIVLEHCVKSCNENFRNEIGKYRFLNEMIKIVSPKYLGQKTTEKVRSKVIQLLYVWSIGLKEQNKIRDAYQMLKQQGIVKTDPEYDDMMLIPTPPPRDEKDNLFKDAERQKRLEKLLKSKNPEDLQAANRLIKSVVMEDQNRMEKIEKRMKMLEEVTNNVRLLNEMLAQFDAMKTPHNDIETMKELHSGCLKLRPSLFRLASDTDDDEQALMEILRANDDLSRVIQSYEKIVLPKLEIDRKGDGEEAEKPTEAAKPRSSLIDLAELEMHSSASFADTSLLSGDLQQPATNGDLFSFHSSTSVTSTNDLSSLFSTPPIASQSTMMTSQTPMMSSQYTAMVMSQQPSIVPQMSSKKPTNTVPPLLPPPPTSNANAASLSDIDLLSRDLLEKTLGRKPGDKFAPKAAVRPTLNQLSTKQTNNAQAPNPTAQPTDILDDLLSLNPPQEVGSAGASEPFSEFLSSKVEPAFPSSVSPVIPTNPTSEALISTAPVPATTAPVTEATTELAPLLPLTDVLVPLESIKPSTLPPLTVYDHNGLRVLFHFAQDFACPERKDTLVTVVSIMSTRPSPIPHIVLQVAVPKVMRVKLQTPSSTQLAAFNPIVPAAPITQVMVLANPNKKEVKMRYKFDYKLDDQTSISERGEICGFPPCEKWGSL